jgi:arsenite/tail-anchored protein-transporting ATPase
VTTNDPFRLRDRRFLFVGGKGGVGKTTVASALALRMAEAGERVLLVSTDPAHSLGDLFDARLGDREREVAPGLLAMEIDPEEEVDRYLERVKANMRAFVRPAMYSEIERQMELARHSPGTEEAALLDRIAELMGEGAPEVDRILFDTAPTGHTLRLLALPEIMTAWTEGLLKSRDRSDSFGRALDRLGAGAGGEREEDEDAGGGAGRDERGARIRELLMERRRRFARARRLLLDPASTAFVLVMIPEKLPILESRRALEALRSHRVPVAGVVVNRVLPPEPLGEFLESRRGQEADYLGRIDREFRDLPRVRVPLLPRDVEGLEGLREVGPHLL